VAGALAVLALVTTNWVLVYFFPSYGLALADAPVAGRVAAPLLQLAGLDAGDVTPEDQWATSSGHTIHLTGIATDPVRTLLFLEIDGHSDTETGHETEIMGSSASSSEPDPLGWPSDPRGSVFWDEAQLGRQEAGAAPHGFDTTWVGDANVTDQFRQHYEALSLGGSVLRVDPLRGAAAVHGARLHVQVTELELPHRSLAGDWAFDVVVFASPSRRLAMPAPVTVNGTRYRVTSVTTTGQMLTVRWTATGPDVDRIVRAADASRDHALPGFGEDVSALVQGSGERELWPSLYGPDGLEVGHYREFRYDFLISASAGQALLDAVVSTPGTYRIAFGDQQPGASVTVTVPAPG
jgi:hypothetical protein